MIEQVGIIGAGTMGNGIAQVCAAAGLTVTMVDISDAAVARGLVDRRLQPGASGQEGEDDGSRPRGHAVAHHGDDRQGKTRRLRPRDRGGDRERGAEGQDTEGSLRDAATAGD